MKTLSIALASLAFSTSAYSATSIFTSQLSENKSVYVSGAFYDSAATEIDHCYVGKAADVCSQISQYSKDSIEAYQSGDHDYLELASCKVEDSYWGPQAVAQYKLVSDYVEGEETVTKTIGSCRTNRESSAKTIVLQASVYGSDLFLVEASFRPEAVEGKTCYFGKPKDVCGQVKAIAKADLEVYKSGDHSYSEFNSCSIDAEGTVSADFVYVDDYASEDLPFTSTIKACF